MSHADLLADSNIKSSSGSEISLSFFSKVKIFSALYPNWGLIPHARNGYHHGPRYLRKHRQPCCWSIYSALHLWIGLWTPNKQMGSLAFCLPKIEQWKSSYLGNPLHFFIEGTKEWPSVWPATQNWLPFVSHPKAIQSIDFKQVSSFRFFITLGFVFPWNLGWLLV